MQEEANQNLDKAIEAYRAILAQYDEERKVAATALFRLAECYRKTGKSEDAVRSYQRLIREFPDQNSLVESSRGRLAKDFGLSPSADRRALESASALLAREQREVERRQREDLTRQRTLELGQQARANDAARRDRIIQMEQEARLAERDAQEQMLDLQRDMRITETRMATLQGQMKLMEEQTKDFERRIEIGTASPNDPRFVSLKKELIGLRGQLRELEIELTAKAERLRALRPTLPTRREVPRAERPRATQPPAAPATQPSFERKYPTAVRVGGDVKEPAKVRDVAPSIPSIAAAAKVAGTVTCEIVVSPDGRVIDARVVRSIPLLDQAALETVRQWRFEPTKKDGKPVPVIMTVPVEFK